MSTTPAATARPLPPFRRCRGGALLLLLLVPGLGWADPCEQLPKPSVTVKRLDEQVSLNTEYGHKALANIAKTLARPGKQVLGLTRGVATVHFAVKTPTFIAPSGRWECASPQITLSFGFSPVTVYVAKEFPEGSCAYKEVHEHEMRHVRTYQTHITSIEKGLTGTLNARFATGAPWRGPAGQTTGQLQRELNERWTPYVLREIRRAEVAQALIDTTEEYERVANACAGEVNKLIR